MAIAYDAVSVGVVNPGASLTFAHTCTGANLVLVVGVKENSGVAEFVTGITYNGVGLTKIAAVRLAAERWTSLWYLINPATGANNIVITASAATFMRGSGVSYTGCNQGAQPDASVTNTQAAGVTFDTTLASIADNCWHIMHVANSTGTHAAGAGTTLRGIATDSNIMDSNSPKTPAGNVTLQATKAIAPGQWASVMATLAPAPLSIGAKSLQFNPLGQNIISAGGR